MQAKIAMIVPYFGKWPEWMDLYLYSCSKNPQVDFLFFTDCLMPATVYPNTLFTTLSFETYCKHVSRVLHVDFRPTQLSKFRFLTNYCKVTGNMITMRSE